MNIWLAVAAVVGLLLITLVAVGARRPRHAEDELAQPKAQPARIDSPGSLNPDGTRNLLRSIHAHRDTGALQLTAGGRICSLYFLFGHLFHAASDALTGEPAVLECVTWQDVRYTFDKTAQLPKVETIQRSIDEILG